MRPNDAMQFELIDPVCGVAINATSPHYCVRGGAMFYFCSEACRARFMAGPLRVVVIDLPARDEPTPVQASPVVDVCEEPVRRTMAEGARKPGGEHEHRPRVGLRGQIGLWFLARRERRHAARASDELLALYRTISADHPEMANRELYKLVVMTRTGCDSMAADAILECAEESFAEWPARRELTLCDVVHYLSVTEFLSAHEGESGIHSNIALVVTSRVPHDLCVLRRKN